MDDGEDGFGSPEEVQENRSVQRSVAFKKGDCAPCENGAFWKQSSSRNLSVVLATRLMVVESSLTNSGRSPKQSVRKQKSISKRWTSRRCHAICSLLVTIKPQ